MMCDWGKSDALKVWPDFAGPRGIINGLQLRMKLIEKYSIGHNLTLIKLKLFQEFEII